MKINVKVNEKSWKFYLQNPEVIIKKKVALLNIFQKKNSLQLWYYLILKKLKN